MAPRYKLTYFDAMARAEPLRYLLAFGDIDYEDNRVKKEDWAQLKPSTPYGKLPILEFDGRTMCQNYAICRYLSRKVGLDGDNDLQNLEIDSTVDTIVDMRVEILTYFFASEEKKEKLKEKLEKETLPFYLNRLQNQVKENGGYFVGGKLTWADLLFAAKIDGINAGFGRNILDGYPILRALVDKVWNIPQIKTWRKSRPKSEM